MFLSIARGVAILDDGQEQLAILALEALRVARVEAVQAALQALLRGEQPHLP